MSLDPISAVLDIGGKVIDRLWPDKAQADAAKLELLKMQQTGELALLTADTELAKAQIAVNQEEAKSDKLWVSGARPFFMWVCGCAFAYHYIIQPMVVFGFACAGEQVALPTFDMESLMNVTMGMLGLGGMRSFDKLKGIK